MSRAHKAKIAEKKAAKIAETAIATIAPAAPAAPAPTGPRTVFTLGYDPGLTFAHLTEHLQRHGITTVIDTRSPTLAKSEERFSGVDVKAHVEAQGVAALQWCSVARIQTAIDATVSSGNVLLLRKEKHTYESKLHLEFARHAAFIKLPCFHLFEDEVIESKSYAKALDTGAEEYDCERFVTETETETA